ncbi:hypothetical protein BJF79_35265 [Actinomadura sp. CNU-125]|uniref:DUF6194 family protein n=1 Tax=Actinomadura sp. CNU-125 TaxID=1904961 RepID=UPI0009625439|nr:DUF6194 family protein [Actinomadura sp. CNU-125]OLT33113.1 hypothetical protein BJF79_35265 [Actinomadura sp. CNU-125]
MDMDEITGYVEAFEGVLAFKPGPGDGTPEIAWGDAFFYYSPDGTVPTTTQPFATIVTKDYPDDEASRLNRPGAFRVNIAAGRAAFVEQTGREPREPDTGDADPGAADTVIAHPVYGELGWLAVVTPGPRTDAAVRDLLRTAYELARDRHRRRAAP